MDSKDKIKIKIPADIQHIFKSDPPLSGETNESQSLSERMVLPALFISRFVTGIPGIISGLLLIEIGNTFGSSLGVTGQISTASSIIRVAAALIMGVLSVRYSHKSLLTVGLILYFFAALGSGFAMNLGMLMLFFTLNGPAFAIVSPMTNTIVGEHYPEEKRTTIIGWLIAGATLSYVVGAQIIARIAGVGGWRFAFLGFFLPLSVLGIVSTAFFIPKGSASQSNGQVISSEIFKAILYHRSAVSCLFVSMFRMSVDMVISLYAVSYVRQQFLISRVFSSTVMTIIALSYTVGSLLAGRLVNRFGRKNIASFSLGIGAAFIFVFFLSGGLWLALAAVWVGALFLGVGSSSGQSLSLEQVPEYRGTMMSLMTAFSGVGSTLGAGLGGYFVLVSNWGTLGIVYGIMGILGALTLFFFASDPINDSS